MHTVYHIEIFRDPHLQRLQDFANSYLDERKELNAKVESAKLQWLDHEYHLTIVLAIPVQEQEG